MSRHAAATNAGRARTLKRTSPAVARRVSGPIAPNRRDDRRSAQPPPPPPSARAPRARIDATALAYADVAVAPRTRVVPAPRPARTFTAPRPQRLAYGGAAIASRMAGVAVDVSASRMMDRLVRSRVWIGVIAFFLIGLVATQVSLLKLNSGIGRAVQTTSTLERSNASLRAEISRLSAGDRIQKLAEADGMIMPAPSDVGYLHAGALDANAARAALRMHAPDPAVAPGVAGAPIEAAVPVNAATGTTASVSGATGPAATAPVATAPVAQAPAPTATVTPAAPVAAQTVPTAAPPGGPGTTATAAPTGAQPATATAAPAAAPSGGATPATATTP